MLKKIKNLFIVEEEGANKAEPSKEAQKKGSGSSQSSAPSQSQGNVTPEQRQTPPPNPNAQPSERFVNKLLEAIEKNNEEGFDYLEFKQSMQNLGNVNMDDATRYQSALAMAKTMGASPTALAKSAQRYLGILSSEEQKFQVAFDNQQKTNVQKRAQEIQANEKGVVDREARIKELQEEIVQLKAKVEELKSAAANADAKVAATKDGFYGAYHILVDQIKGDLEMIQKHGS